jgi:hypothetical protein
VPLSQYWRSTLDLGDRVNYEYYLFSLEHLFYLNCIDCLVCLFAFAAWLELCDSKIIFERRMQSQVLYVVPITSILRRLALVPVGDTGTIPFTMRKESKDLPGASCDTKMGAGDGSRWWYINSVAMKWAKSQ